MSKMEFKDTKNYEVKVPIVKVDQFGNTEINYDTCKFIMEEYFFVGE